MNNPEVVWNPKFNRLIKDQVSIEEILDYEVRSSWLAQYISQSWLQDVLVSFLLWKVRRKFTRYSASKAFEKKVY